MSRQLRTGHETGKENAVSVRLVKTAFLVHRIGVALLNECLKKKTERGMVQEATGEFFVERDGKMLVVCIVCLMRKE